MSQKSELVVVGAATRGRAGLFPQLLEGLSQLDEPAAAGLAFVFVQNDPEFTIAAAVDRFAAETGWSAKAVHEPRPGIPQARNAAVDAALSLGADWLAFIDDDETPAADWIARLHAGALAKELDLCGGPVEQRRPDLTLDRRQEAIFDFYERMARERSAMRASGWQTNLHLATNNWLCSRRLLAERGMRFDEAMALTGGSDTDFSRRAMASGYRLGWVPEARVSEVFPAEKLTASYVYRRSQSQTMAKYHLKYRKAGRSARGRAFFHFVTKTLGGGARAALWPLCGSYAGLRGVRSVGVGTGWLKAAMGYDSQLYEQVIDLPQSEGEGSR